VFYSVCVWKLMDDFAVLPWHVGRAGRVGRAHELSLVDEEANETWRALSAVSQLPFLSGNAADLLIDGKATFESIFAGIDRAQHVIYAQFYIIRDDRLGREFADRLIARATAGVEVYLLYDDVGCFWLPHRYLKRLEDAG